MKHRYIGFIIKPISTNISIKQYEVLQTLNYYCTTIFGKTCREMGIRIIRFTRNKGIVRCNHIEKKNTINLLNSITSIASNRVMIKTVGTSGTIKSLIKKYMINLEDF